MQFTLIIMKIVIPVAGLGSRLKPHTHTMPKPLMEVAGKPILEYIIENSLKLNPSEIIFVVGYMKESIKGYIDKFHLDLNCRFVEQKVRDGDGSAVRIALENLEEDEELLVIFGDTLIDFDLKEILRSKNVPDSIIFGMSVEDPEHYGIMNVKDNREIYEVEEKPKKPKSDIAIIGTYYFKSALMVKNILDEFHKKMETIKGEFKIVQVIKRYIEMVDRSIKVSIVKKWFDCGRVEVLLNANHYFLEKSSKGNVMVKGNSVIIPPSYVSKNAKIDNCVIGPYASIGDDCEIKDSVVKNSIVGYRSKIENLVMKNSLIGKDVVLHGKPTRINIGEKSEMYLE